MSNNCLKAKSFILLLLMKNNRQKQRFCHPKMADLKAWSHGVRKANWSALDHVSEMNITGTLPPLLFMAKT